MDTPGQSNTANEKELFLQAFDITDPVEQETFINEQCSSPEQAARLRALLEAEKTSDALLSPESCPDLQKSQRAIVQELATEHTQLETLRKNTQTVGDYALHEELGAGSTGIVFRATQISLQRPVAIKLILHSTLDTHNTNERFQLEAKAAARLKHPNIVPIYEVGSEGRYHFYSMPIFQRGTLASRLQEITLTKREAVQLVVKITDAICIAHQQGILHRDLKPENILLDEQDEPHVSDFGIACKLESPSSSLTLAGQIMGTPRYMAPEQTDSQLAPITTAVDIYSIGAILYELLSGTPVFTGETIIETIHQVRNTEPTSLRRIQPDIDQNLDTIVLKCLDKSPTRRYESARALKEDLEAWLDNREIKAREISTLERFGLWIKRHPLHAGLIATATLLLFTLGIGGPVIAYREFKLNAKIEQERIRAEANAAEAQRQAARNRNLAYASTIRLVELSNALEKRIPLLPNTMIRFWENEDQSSLTRDWEWYYLFGDIHLKPLVYNTQSTVHSLHFSPDGRHLAYSTSKQTAVRDSMTSVIQTILSDSEEHRHILWSSDQTCLATLSESGAVKIWSTDTGRLKHRLPTDISFASLSWAPDSHQLATLDSDGRLQMWQLDSNHPPQPTGQPSAPYQGLHTIHCSPDGSYIAAAGHSNDILLWPMQQLDTTPIRFTSHSSPVSAIAWQENGLALASGDLTGNVHIQSVPDGLPLASFTVDTPQAIDTLIWNPGEQVLLFNIKNDSRIQRYDLTLNQVDTYSDVSASISALARSYDAHAIAFSNTQGDIQIHRYGLPPASRVLHENSKRWMHIRWNQTGNAVDAIDIEGNVQRIYTDTQEINSRGTRLNGKLVDAAWNHAGPKVAVLIQDADEHTIKLIDPRRPRAARHYPIDIPSPRALAWVGRSDILVAGSEGSVIFFNTRNKGDPTPHAFPTPPGFEDTRFIHISANPQQSKALATGIEGEVVLWSITNHQILFADSGDDSDFVSRAHAWHPSGDYFALGNSHGRVTVWSVNEQKALHTYRAHNGPLTAIAWHPGGHRLATGGRDDKIRLWDWRKGELFITLEGHMRPISCLAWDIDGNSLVSGDNRGVLRQWNATSGILLSNEALDVSVSE